MIKVTIAIEGQGEIEDDVCQFTVSATANYDYGIDFLKRKNSELYRARMSPAKRAAFGIATDIGKMVFTGAQKMTGGTSEEIRRKKLEEKYNERTE